MEQLTKAVKEDRASRLSDVTEKIREEFLKKQIGKTVEVLFETEKDGFCEGYTQNYTPIMVYSTEKCKGKFITVKIIDSEKDYCIGKFI